MSAAAAVKLVLPERIPKAEPLPAVRHALICMSAAIKPAPAVHRQAPAPGLTADRLRRQGRQAAVRLPPDTPVLTALKQNVCMKDALPVLPIH